MSTVISKNKVLVFPSDLIAEQNIEFIGIINKRGKITELLGSDSLHMPKSKKEMFLMKIALRTAMQRDFDEDLGKVNYCMTQRGTKKFISIPAPDCNTILIVAKNEFEHEEFAKKTIQKIECSGQFLDVFFKEADS